MVARTKDSEHVALLCHQNADPDAVCSAAVLQELLRKLLPGIEVGIFCPEGISASTKQLLENLGITVPSERVPKKMDLAILVDTNTLDQLGVAGNRLFESGPDIVVIDHHHPHPDTEKIAAQMIVDESAAAAAEIVYDLVRASEEPLGRLEAMALLAALFVETKHFLLATRTTFEVAAELVRAGADPRHLAETLNVPMNRSERIARLRGASRTQFASMGNWIVVTSELGSYQSSAARALVSLGAHVAMVGGETKNKIRINMRASEDFYSRTGVHLGRDLAIPIGKALGGTGGGHPTAAGLSVPGVFRDAMDSCVKRLKELLGPFQT